MIGKIITKHDFD